LVIAVAALGAVVLWAVTGWLWLVVHEGCIDRSPLPAAVVCNKTPALLCATSAAREPGRRFPLGVAFGTQPFIV